MKLKKIIPLLLIISLLAGLLCAASAAPSASLSPQTVKVNGSAVDLEVYNIGGYNYFKLRDLASLLTGTDSQFEVGYDEASERITLTTGTAYTSVGGELAAYSDRSASAFRSLQSLYIDGKFVSMTAYNIGDNNFFKLRDLGNALGFLVEYDSSSDCALISTGSSETPAKSETQAAAQSGVSFVFSSSGVTASGGSGYTIDGCALSITAGGTYTFSGSCPEGSISVEKDCGEVTLILNGLDLSCSTTAPLDINSGSTAHIIVSAGSRNSLCDSDRAEEKPKAALNASESLTISGAGSLSVTGNNKNGIKTDCILTVSEVSLSISSVDNALCADDMVTVNGGSISLTAGGDGIHVSPDAVSDETRGDVTITGGELSIVSSGDGIQADGTLAISGGSFDIKTGGGASAVAGDTSCKGLKGTGAIRIYGGSFSFDCCDDCIHSNNDVYIQNGSFVFSTGDDCVHGDETLTVDGGSFYSSNCYEGLEAATVVINGGTVELYAGDDGINAAGGSDTGMAGMFGQDSFGAGSGAYSITINGGNIKIVSDGDCIDSNGALTITGGVLDLTCNGNGNTALDCDGTYSCENADVTTNDGSESGNMMGAPGGMGGMGGGMARPGGMIR